VTRKPQKSGDSTSEAPESPDEQFARERVAEIAEMARDVELATLSREWMLASAKHRYTYNFRWLGRPIIQFPQDLVALQELIYEVQPDVIVETGIARGGGLVFFASMLELNGGGRVFGIDIDIRAHNRRALQEHRLWPRIELLEGSSSDPDIFDRVVRRLRPDERVLVILDSNHTHEHVLDELRLWSPIVETGSYVVVMDTSVEHAPAELFPDRPWGPGNSPGSAVAAFLEETDCFEVDPRCEKLLVTVAPSGFLRAVANPRPRVEALDRPSPPPPPLTTSRDAAPVVTGVGSPPGRLVSEVTPGLPVEGRVCSCRWCGETLTSVLVDLGKSPLANSFVPWERRDEPELFLPLCTYVCNSCFLVQVPEFAAAESIFSDYLYFSSYSRTWLEHNAALADDLIALLGLDGSSRVVEVASNDGYMLRNFVAAGVPCLGVEPAANVAQVALDAGIPTRIGFFDRAMSDRLVAEGGPADLILAINVLAHVPDLRDFVTGLSRLLAPDGVLLLEFPSLKQLLSDGLFDTIYHEHFSYFSLHVVQRILREVGMRVFDVHVRPTHGGSLRVLACRSPCERFERSSAVDRVLAEERDAGLCDGRGYRTLQARADATKAALLSFLLEARKNGRTVAGYGAPAKGNTLLNYCGVGRDLFDFTVDISPHKQGTWLPGTGVPVLHPDALESARPDYVLVLPWNLREEIREQLRPLTDLGTKLVVALPELEVLE
jgi:cephalosporin hydroxylase/SAM-dependent methyltransferase